MDSNHFNLHHPLPVTDNDMSGVYDPLLGLVDDGYHSTSEALPNVPRQSHISTNHELNVTSSYLIANSFMYTDSPPSVIKDLSSCDWSQHFPHTTGYFKDFQDDGTMQSFEGINTNTIPVLHTVDHDDFSRPSASAPPHSVEVISLEPPTVQVLVPSSIKFDSMPSSTRTTTSLSNNEGRSPNTRGAARYHCNDCGTSSTTKRDYERHLTTKKYQKKTSDGSGSENGAVLGFHCLAQGCEYSHEGGKSFTREDNLWRHMKTVHPVRSTA